MSATYQTQIMDTSAVEVPLHEPLADVEALDLVLQISRKWNLNRLFRYLRVQHTNQSESKGSTTRQRRISRISVAITDKDTAMADFRALVGELLDASSNGASTPAESSVHGQVTTQARAIATRTRRDRVTRAAVTGTSA